MRRRSCERIAEARALTAEAPRRCNGAAPWWEVRGQDERVAVVATLLPDSRERATEIIAKGAPYGLRLAGFRRHSVFLAEEAVVFVFEGQGIEGLVRNLVNDPSVSAAFGAWAPLLQGTPVLAREAFYWQAR